MRDIERLLPKDNKTFHPRVINNTNITFSDNELRQLSKGLEYNLCHKPSNLITTLALGAETALCSLPTHDQDYFRWQVAKNLNRPCQQQNNNNYNKDNQKAHTERRTIENIKRKLNNNYAIVARADKGNSIIVMFRNDYMKRIDNFTSSNQFDVVNTDSTNSYQKLIRSNLNSCKLIIHNEIKSKLINLNPGSPYVRGMTKVLKPENLIRRVMNWTNAPAHKAAKFFATSLSKLISVPYSFNIKNSIQLINDLDEIVINPYTRLASLDISNMYTNIPTQDLRHVIANTLNHTYLILQKDANT